MDFFKILWDNLILSFMNSHPFLHGKIKTCVFFFFFLVIILIPIVFFIAYSHVFCRIVLRNTGRDVLSSV